jgi:hypothetical protein
VAASEKIEKFVPAPSHVAPSGYGFPGKTLRANSNLNRELWFVQKPLLFLATRPAILVETQSVCAASVSPRCSVLRKP